MLSRDHNFFNRRLKPTVREVVRVCLMVVGRGYKSRVVGVGVGVGISRGCG